VLRYGSEGKLIWERTVFYDFSNRNESEKNLKALSDWSMVLFDERSSGNAKYPSAILFLK